MKNTHKLAFTMLELVFVIVVMGLMTSLAIPRLERDHLQDAAVQILQDIRYTQHLALMDDKTNPTQANWQRSFWMIRFAKYGDKWIYQIGSNMDLGANIDQNESAIDPTTRKLFYSNDANIDSGESPRIFISDKFGVTNVDFTTCSPITGRNGINGSQHIGFDYLGRPHKGIFGATNDYGSIMQEDCTIKFTMSDNQEFNITIERETGHAFIGGQPDR